MNYKSVIWKKKHEHILVLHIWWVWVWGKGWFGKLDRGCESKGDRLKKLHISAVGQCSGPNPTQSNSPKLVYKFFPIMHLITGIETNHGFFIIIVTNFQIQWKSEMDFSLHGSYLHIPIYSVSAEFSITMPC